MDILVFFSTPKQVELLHAPVLLTGDFALILYTRRAPLPVIRSGAHNSTYIEVKQPQLAMYFWPITRVAITLLFHLQEPHLVWYGAKSTTCRHPIFGLVFIRDEIQPHLCGGIMS